MGFLNSLWGRQMPPLPPTGLVDVSPCRGASFAPGSASGRPRRPRKPQNDTAEEDDCFWKRGGCSKTLPRNSHIDMGPGTTDQMGGRLPAMCAFVVSRFAAAPIRWALRDEADVRFEAGMTLILCGVWGGESSAPLLKVTLF